MEHSIKIKQCYLIHILERKKHFEVRENDRDYQVGDLIRFLPIMDENYNAHEVMSPIPCFEVVYIYTGLGMVDGFVVLGIDRM